MLSISQRRDGPRDDDLALSYRHYQPVGVPDRADPVAGWVIGNTCEHEDAHLSRFEGLLSE